MFKCILDFETFHMICKDVYLYDKGSELHIAALYKYLYQLPTYTCNLLDTIDKRFHYTKFYDTFDELKRAYHDTLKKKSLEDVSKEQEGDVMDAIHYLEHKNVFHYRELRPKQDCYLVTY